MSAFVICLVVVGAAIAVLRTAGHDQPATVAPNSDRDPRPTDRRPRHLATGGHDVEVPAPLKERVRSGVLLAMLLTGLGALAAALVGVLVLVTLTAVRTAIG